MNASGKLQIMIFRIFNVKYNSFELVLDEFERKEIKKNLKRIRLKEK